MNNPQKTLPFISLVLILAGCSTTAPDQNIQNNTGNAAVNTGNAVVNTGNAVVNTGNAVVNTGNAVVNTGNTVVNTGNAAVKQSKDNENIAKKSTSDNQSMNIENTEIKFLYPKNCNINKNTSEPNRRGSFVSYGIVCASQNTKATLQEIQFFNENSISAFEERCKQEEGFCFMGMYPTLKSYYEQVNIFRSSAATKKIGSLNYIISQFPAQGEMGEIREYTTFIDDTKVDIRVYIPNKEDSVFADELVEQLDLTK